MWALGVGHELDVEVGSVNGEEDQADSCGVCSRSTADLKMEHANYNMQMGIVCSRKCLIKMPLALWIHTCYRYHPSV